MNVYHCWYHGIKGYGCRVQDTSWIFVPELSQPDKNCYRNLMLLDLEFANDFEKQHELNREVEILRKRWSRLFLKFLSGDSRPRTIYGRLFLTE